MKKIKLISAVALASSLILAGCGHEHTFSDAWESDDNQHWHPATCEHKDQKGSVANHVDADQDGKCDVCEHDVYVDPIVKSVTISGAKDNDKLDVGFSIELTAEVKVVGGAATGVKWSVDNDNAILSAASGKTVTVTGSKEGKVVVTAKSAFDETKLATVELNVVDEGFDPSWIEDGFTYSKEFPVEKIKEFLGEGEYEVYAPAKTVGGGFYYRVLEEDEMTPGCFVIVADGVIDTDYAKQLLNSGITRMYVSSLDFYEAVDQTGKYTVSFSSTPDYEAEEYVAPTMFYFYKSEDVWDSSTLTSDTAWDDAKIVNKDADAIAKAKEWVSKVPFVKLGEDYYIELVQDDSLKYEIIDFLEMLGIDVTTLSEEELAMYLEAFGYYGPEEYLAICDYSIAEPFDSYEQTLVDAGFIYTEYEDEYGEVYSYYELGDGLVAYDLSFGFGETGNTIYVELGVATLNAFPINEANDFIKNVVGSENCIIAYEETEGTNYQAVISDNSMEIVAFDVTLAQALAYAEKLAALDFKIEYTPASDEEYPSWVATKGKLVYEFYLEQAYDEQTEEYLDEGDLIFFIYGDDTKHEVQGIYLPEAMSAMVADGAFELEPEIVKIDEPTLVVTSSNTAVATVDGLTVTPVADGETTITVSVANTTFAASTVLTVTSKSHFDLALDECNEWLALCGVEEPLVLPLPTGGKVNDESDYYYDEYYECYTIYVYGDCDDVAYANQLEAAGFEIDEDEYGFFATKGDVLVSPWMYDDVLEIDIYYAPQSEGVTFDFTVDPFEWVKNQGVTGEVDGFYFEAVKGSGSSAPATQSDTSDFGELRLYDKNELTISSDTEITSIEIICNNCSCSKSGAELTCSTGKLEETSTGYIWTGSANEVTFTCVRVGSSDKGKQCHIETININGGGEGGGGGGGQTSDLGDFADEVSLLLFEEEGVLEYDSLYDEYWCAYLSEQKTIMAACEEICDILAEVYDEYQAPTLGTDEEGDYVDACYGADGYEIYVLTYEVSEGIVFQIEVYEA